MAGKEDEKMARTRTKPQQLLTEALRAAKSAARDGILKSSALARKHREILVRENYLSEIIGGWYLLTSPAGWGESTAWFGSFWTFLRHYLSGRFGADGFCLSAESSLNLHAGDTTVPKQIVVLTRKASNTSIDLPHDTSLLLLLDKANFPKEREKREGLWLMRLAYALCRATPAYYAKNPRAIEIALKSPSLSVAEISRTILKYGAFAGGERIIGAYRHLGEAGKGRQIEEDLIATGYKVHVVNPFAEYEPCLRMVRSVSPYAGRIHAMWNGMRGIVARSMAKPRPLAKGVEEIISDIREKYTADAYNSLSIEGYQVTAELIERIESGRWDPESDVEDRRQRDVLAAKGYQQAFQAVLASVRRVVNRENPGQVFEEELQNWYRRMFAPLVAANLMKATDLAGYRDQLVYIRGARHVPPPKSAVPDCMEKLFELLKNEESPAVAAVLGHFFFVFIHPYMDGNGRIARFLMNLMLIAGGFDWTIIKVDHRDRYLAALEAAATQGDILPLAAFIKGEMARDPSTF
jgi:hypothetical protein